MAQHGANPANDRQAQAISAGRFRLGAFPPIELLEYPVELVATDAGSGIPDFETDAAGAAARYQQHAAFGRIADCVGDQISQDPLQQQRVGLHVQTGPALPESQPLGSGDRNELLPKGREHFVQIHDLLAGLNGAGVQAGDLQQLLDQLGQRFDRTRQVLRQRLQRPLSPLAQQRAVDADRLQRLPQVVAGRREELRLGPDRAFRGAPRFLGQSLLVQQLLDQDLVLVVLLDRFRHRLAEIASEEQREQENREQHDRGAVVRGIVLLHHPHQQRQHGQREEKEQRAPISCIKGQ